MVLLKKQPNSNKPLCEKGESIIGILCWSNPRHHLILLLGETQDARFEGGEGRTLEDWFSVAAAMRDGGHWLLGVKLALPWHSATLQVRTGTNYITLHYSGYDISPIKGGCT